MTEILLVEDEESVNRGIEFTLTKGRKISLRKLPEKKCRRDLRHRCYVRSVRPSGTTGTAVSNCSTYEISRPEAGNCQQEMRDNFPLLYFRSRLQIPVYACFSV